MTEKINWKTLPIRCSCLGQIMTEAKDKATKDAGGLGKTCIAHLAKIYVWEKYGRRKDIVTAAMSKGTFVEEDSITLISQVEKKMYKKNEERIVNEFLSGTPDMYDGKSILKATYVKDAKSAWDLESFIKNETDGLDKNYYWQLQGYFDLTGAKRGSVDFCLVNTPPHLIVEEKKKLFYKMNAPTEENIDYKIACAELEYNMIFDDIPPEERVIKFEVDRNDEDIERAHQKVIQCREWLAEFDEMRMKRYKN